MSRAHFLNPCRDVLDCVNIADVGCSAACARTLAGRRANVTVSATACASAMIARLPESAGFEYIT